MPVALTTLIKFRLLGLFGSSIRHSYLILIDSRYYDNKLLALAIISTMSYLAAIGYSLSFLLVSFARKMDILAK